MPEPGKGDALDGLLRGVDAGLAEEPPKRLMGLILAAIAVELISEGLVEPFPALARKG